MSSAQKPNSAGANSSCVSDFHQADNLSSTISSLAINVVPAADTGETIDFLANDQPVIWSPLSHLRGTCCSDLPSGSVARAPRAQRTAFALHGDTLSRADAHWSDRYFEPQVEAHCGMHALNNLIGAPQFTQDDLQAATAQVIAETDEHISDHVAPGGWYSHSVLVSVLYRKRFHLGAMT